MKTYVIKSGDTLQRIAARFWGDWTLYCVLKDVNSNLGRSIGFNWETLPAGYRLEIPTLPSSEKSYIVQGGDSWESIALAYYFTERLSYLLASANENQIIYKIVGQTIRIPALVQSDVVRRLENV